MWDANDGMITKTKSAQNHHHSTKRKRKRKKRRPQSFFVVGFGCIALSLPIAIVLQLIGIASMISYLSPLVPSPLWNSHEADGPIRSWWEAYFQHKTERLQQEQHRADESGSTSLQQHPMTVSACLLVMDDNHVIPEWLAYHYTTLPLRRVIVASDPRAVTSPTALLQKWNHVMNVTVWNDLDYFPKSRQKVLVLHHQHRLRQEQWNDTKKNDPAGAEASVVIQKTLTLLHRFRQRNFYATCMRQLQAEKKTQHNHNNSNWVLFVDSDEFVAINQPFWKFYGNFKELLQLSTPTTSLPLSSQKDSNNDNDPINHTATTTIIDLSKETIISSLFLRQESNHTNPLTRTPCVGLPRIQMGTQEDNEAVSSTTALLLQQMGLTRNHFLTLRYPYHGPSRSVFNKAGKGLLDVSRVEKRYMRVEETDVHRPNRRYCTNEDMWMSLRESPLALYHHVGSLSQWMYRSDPRAGKRTVESYQPFAALNTTRVPNQLGLWIDQFVHQVGLEQAMTLLQGVGQIVDIPTKQTTTDEAFLDRLLESFAQDSQHHRDATIP